MRTEREFNISVIIVTKMITYKFLRGFLLRIRDTSANGVLHLAILALLDTRQTLIAFHQSLPRLPVSQKRLLYKFY